MGRTVWLTLSGFPLLVVILGYSTIVYSQTQPQVGYAVMTPSAGASAGVALYGYWNNRGVLLSEAGFGSLAPIALGRIFVVEQGGIRTGVAIVNPTAGSVTVHLTLRDAGGQLAGQRSDVYTAGQHQSLFVDELFPGIQNFTGSLTFQTDSAGVTVVAVRMNVNYMDEPLLTTIAVTDLNAPLASPTIVPHLAAGDGLSTEVVLMNTSGQPVSGTIRLFADNGSPAQFLLNGTSGSAFPYSIAAQGVFTGQLMLSGPLVVGHAEVAPAAGSPASPGLVIFQFTRTDGLISEAGIATGALTSAGRIFVDQANTRTGVAIANPNPNSVSVSFSLFDMNGNALQQANRNVAGKGHASFFADEMFTGLASGFTGLMEIDSSPSVAIVALRLSSNSRQDTMLATLPLLDLTRPQTASPLVFPQIAFGYFGSDFLTTREILLNQSLAVAAVGTVQYRGIDGTPLSQPLGCPSNTFSYSIPAGGATDTQRPCWPPFITTTKMPASQPVISSGTGGSPMTALDPSILKDSEGYHLFFTSLFCNNGSGYYFSWDANNPAACNMFDTIGATAYAFSADQGLTWQIRTTPVFYPGTAGAWDSRKIETPNVVRVNNRLYLFYSADATGFDQRFQIGVTALDLTGGSVRTTLMTNNAVFPRTTGPLIPYETSVPAFTNNVQEPSVIYNNGQFEVYFVGLQLQLPGQAIDAPGQGIRYVGLGRRVFDSQFNVVEHNDTPMLDWVNIPEVRFVSNAYFLFYTTIEPGEFHENEKIEYRISIDGLTWSDPIPLLMAGPASSFDGWGVSAPTFQPETNSFVVFYMAFGAENHPCSFSAGGRLGTPVSNGQMCVYNSIGRATAILP